jgi:hypothetical protein
MMRLLPAHGEDMPEEAAAEIEAVCDQMDALSRRIEDRITDRDDVHVRTLLLRRCHREAVTSGNAYGDLTLAARLLGGC